MANRPAPALTLSVEQREELETWARSRVLPQRQVLRARIVLRAAAGVANESIAAELGCSKPTVLQWRTRFGKAGLDGLVEAPGRGRRPSYDQPTVDRVVSITLGKPPKGMTHGSSRLVAREAAMSFSTVQRIWRNHRLQPHRTRSFKFSTDPQLLEKVTDVVGLYLHPPEQALVLCVDPTPRSKRWIALSRCCRCVPAKWSGAPTITSVTAPPGSLPPSTSPPVSYYRL